MNKLTPFYPPKAVPSRFIFYSRLFLYGTAVLLLLLLVQPTAAAGIIVNDFADDYIAGDGLCTLREAVDNANNDLDLTDGDCAAGSGADTIFLDAGTYSLYYFDGEVGGTLYIWDDLTIEGLGPDSTIIEAAELVDRPFYVFAAVTMTGLTITDGTADGSGGAIAVTEGDLILIDTVLTNNHAVNYFDIDPGNGGAIYFNGGQLWIENSVISNNTADDDGGAILINLSYFSDVTILDSTIRNNATDTFGGGIANVSGSVSIFNSTIDSNTAVLGGGGIYNSGDGYVSISETAVTRNTAGSGIFSETVNGGGIYNSGVESGISLYNSTVSGNQAADLGGGLYNDAGSDLSYTTLADNEALGSGGGVASDGFISYQDSILAGNTAVSSNDDCYLVSGSQFSGGFNILSASTNCATDSSDIFVAASDVFISVIGVLANNGGPSETHALLPGSPAIDAGNADFCPETDQRGIVRPQGAACDIGAYEAENNDTPQIGPTFSVNTADDLNDDLCSVQHCSLREAIIASNNSEGSNTIIFDIPETFFANIEPLSSLPAVTDPATISTYLGSTYVELSGTAAASPGDGLIIEAGSTVVEGLTIRDFDGHGILLSNFGGNSLQYNTIYNNRGVGVRVLDGTSNTLTGNNIFDNGGLGIDLDGDGVTTNDINDADTGANDLVNFPFVIRAVPDIYGTAVEGIYHGQPNTDYILEFFSNAACDPSNFGEGEYFLGSLFITTDEDGGAVFNDQLYFGEGGYQQDGGPNAINEFIPEFVTATATDEAGNTSEFSQCTEVGPGNDSWPRALALPLVPDDVTPEVLTAVYDQFIDTQDQSRWYKFQVEPGSQVIVTLTGLPENYDLTVYKDIAATFNDLLAAEDNTDLLELGAEFAPDAFSPDAFSPDAFSPDAFSPDAFSPDAFSPDAFSPDAFSPDAFSPDAFSPDAFSPDAFSPDAFSPDAFSPDAFSPDAFSPDAFSPDAFSPDAFSSAQTRSLLGVSAFNGTAGEGIILNTWENSGDFYIRVRGRNGAFSLDAPFHLEVMMTTGVCNGVSGVLPASDLVPTAGDFDTIILADLDRLTNEPVARGAVQAKLNELAAQPEVNGVVVDVSSDSRVAAANVQADAFPTCPFAKNLVAHAIKDIVDGYRELNPLAYIVIIGNDDVIPFFRHPDQAMLANERNYVPPVQDNTASQASLKLGYVLSQDRYGADRQISRRSDSLPIPKLAVGRLVEEPLEIIGMIDVYLATSDGVVDTPTSALVTGYDFLEDAANAVTAELEAGLGTTADTLIVPRDLSPQDPLAWTGEDLANALLGSRHDVNYLAGHFSASSALAADYTTRLLASEVANSAVDLSNALIFSAGCHSGYNIVNDHGIFGITAEPDWAQAFAQKQATLIAGTGYQYGDTDFIEYSERLYLEFSHQLRLGTGPVAVGQALAAAKQVYLADTPNLKPIHEKALLEATLFGLPFYKIDMPNGRITPPADDSIVDETSGFATNPGLTLGLQFADVTITPSLTTEEVELDIIGGATEAEAVTDGTVTATYLRGSGGATTNPAEPVLPVENPNVTVPGMVLRGVGFRGGSYSDMNDVLPLTGAATTEIRGVHPPFLSSIFYPVQFWKVNYFDALASGGMTRLFITPAQYQSASPSSLTGTLRQFSSLNFRLFYSNYNTVSTISGNNPALAAPPAISNVTTAVTNDNLHISARVVGDPSAGIQEVWVTYTALSGPYAGIWQSLNLTQNASDTTLWEGILPLNGTPEEDIQFIIQAVNGVGLVSSLTNMGAYMSSTFGTEPATEPDPTEVSLLNPPTSGTYGSSVTVSARLTSDNTPLPGQFITFKLGGQQRSALTDSSGEATVSLALLGLPGDETLAVNFGGTAVYQPASDSSPFTINRQPTTITFDPVNEVVIEGETAHFTATLTDGGQRPLGEKTIIFIINSSGGSEAQAVITDYAGRAFLSLTKPLGSYTIDAYFGGTIPLPGQTLTLEDDRYLSTTAAASLQVISTGGQNELLYLSANSDGLAGSVIYADEDIVTYDPATGDWALFLDGSDIGLKGTDIDALHMLDDGSILLSFEQKINIAGYGKVQGADIVRFIPTSVGEDTAGSFEMYFDGSDYELKKFGEGVDAIGFTPDGRLLVSTLAAFKVPQTNGGQLRGNDDDLIVLNASGDWELYFNGSDVWHYTEDVWGLWVDSLTGDIYVSMQNEFTIGSLSGDGLDIFVCHPITLGSNTSCVFADSLYFDGSEAGFSGNIIDGFAIQR